MTLPNPVAVVCERTAHAIPTSIVFPTSYFSTKGGLDVTILQVSKVATSRVKPFIIIMQLATGGVNPKDVQTTSATFALPLLAPIGVPVSTPLKVDIVPLFNELVVLENVKSVAATSAAVANFHHKEDVPVLVGVCNCTPPTVICVQSAGAVVSLLDWKPI